MKFNFIGKIKYELLVFVVFVLLHLPSLGWDCFNTDVWKWKARSYDFGTGVFTIDFEKTLQKYHPGVTLMWAGSMGIKVFNFYNETFRASPFSDNDIGGVFGLHFTQKLFVLLMISTSVSFIFYVLRDLFGLKYAVFATFLMAMEPFYLGLTRVFHLEGLLSTFMIASACWTFYYIQNKNKEKSWRYLIISAIFGSLALLTKTSSLYIILFTALVLFLDEFRTNRNFFYSLRSMLKPFSKWLGVFILVFFALWPALWVNPVLVFQTLYRGVSVVGVERDHIQIYFGKLVEDPGPLYYFVVLALRSSIILFIGFFLTLIFGKKVFSKRINRDFAIFLSIFAFFYFVQLTIPSKKLDRYILPSMLSLSLLTSFTYLWLVEKIKIHSIFQFILVAILPVYTVFYIHPDYFSYYSPLFGGLKSGIYMIEPKWLVGEREIEQFFKDIKKEKNYKDSYDTSFEQVITLGEENTVLSAAFPEKYYTQIWPFFRNFGSWAVIKDLTPFAVQTRYFVYPVWEDDSSEEDRFILDYVGQIKVRGVTLYNVYSRREIK